VGRSSGERERVKDGFLSLSRNRPQLLFRMCNLRSSSILSVMLLITWGGKETTHRRHELGTTVSSVMQEVRMEDRRRLEGKAELDLSGHRWVKGQC
jgi:hypothetical protein